MMVTMYLTFTVGAFLSIVKLQHEQRQENSQQQWGEVLQLLTVNLSQMVSIKTGDNETTSNYIVLTLWFTPCHERYLTVRKIIFQKSNIFIFFICMSLSHMTIKLLQLKWTSSGSTLLPWNMLPSIRLCWPGPNPAWP